MKFNLYDHNSTKAGGRQWSIFNKISIIQTRWFQIKMLIVISRATTKKIAKNKYINKVKEITRELKWNTRKYLFSTKETVLEE